MLQILETSKAVAAEVKARVFELLFPDVRKCL
jgi:hypothetical protein